MYDHEECIDTFHILYMFITIYVCVCLDIFIYVYMHEKFLPSD